MNDKIEICFKISNENEICSKLKINLSKLKTNKEIEDVWTFQDDSFINLIYTIKTKNKNQFKSLTFRETIKIDKKEKKNDEQNDNSIKSTKNNFEILQSNLSINDPKNIYSTEYISQLDYNEIEYDTFCHCFFISGLKYNNTELVEKSEEYPSPCLHKECSILSSFQPSVLQSYQNPNKKFQIELSELTSNLVFPLGIKLCFNYDTKSIYPKPYNSFLNIIRNQKGDIYYIVTLHYFREMSMIDFDKKYKINPLKEYTKFKNINDNDKNFDDKKFEQNLEIITQFIDNETVLIPECMTLVSRFPFINQMENCLKTMINLNNDDLNNLINHLTNEIPVPFRNQKILFYIPYNPTVFQLVCPFRPSMVNFTTCNILKYLSIENIIKIFHLILLEQKILFIHNDYQILSYISFAFVNLIYPFNWVNPYIPILSLSSVQFLQSIVPFIMGTDEFLFNYSVQNDYIGLNNDNNIIFVDIENDEITINVENIIKKRYLFNKDVIKTLKLPEFPEDIGKFLKYKLKEIKKIHKNDYIVEEKIRDTFLKVLVMMFGNFQVFIFTTNDMPIFNSESFLLTKDKEKGFYNEIIQTQDFNQFLLNENNIIIRKRNKMTEILNEPYGKKYDNLLIDSSLFTIKSRKQLNEIEKTLYNFKVRARSIKKKASKIKKNISVSDFKNSSHDLDTLTSLSNSKGLNLMTESNSLFDTDSNDTNNLKKKKNNPYIQKTTLLFPYFIESPMSTIDREQIEIYINNEINKRNYEIKDIKKKPKYIIEGNKIYKINEVKDIYRRYFYNISIPSENTIKSSIPIRKKSLSTYDLLKYKKIDEIQLILDWFNTICNEEFEMKKIKIDNINNLMKKQKNREYFANLISQGYTLNDNFKKSLLKRSYEEMLKIITFILNIVTEREYDIIKLFTIAIFSYFTYDKVNKKVKYIYQDYINSNIKCVFWGEKEFWKNWFVKDLNNGEIYIFDEENEIDNQYLPYSIKLLIKIYSFMVSLNLNKEFIQELIFNNLGSNYLNGDEIYQLKIEISKL